MEKKKIIWIDDDIETPILDPYVDELEEDGFSIIKVKKTDGFMDLIKNESDTITAILVDIIMPPGDIDFGEARGGLRTGIVILKKILEDRDLETIPKIVVSNVDDSVVIDFCKKQSIPCLSKGEYFSNTFVEKVKELILKELK